MGGADPRVGDLQGGFSVRQTASNTSPEVVAIRDLVAGATGVAAVVADRRRPREAAAVLAEYQLPFQRVEPGDDARDVATILRFEHQGIAALRVLTTMRAGYIEKVVLDRDVMHIPGRASRIVLHEHIHDRAVVEPRVPHRHIRN